MKARDITLLTCYYLLTSMYLYAAVSKLLSFQVSVAQMKRQPFPDEYALFLAWAIPLIEIGISLLMMTVNWRKPGLYMGTFLLLCFTIYIIFLKLNFYGEIPCSCGGVISTFNLTQHIIFNSSFLTIAFIGLYLEWFNTQKSVSVNA
jgi:putative oxidoreductase